MATVTIAYNPNDFFYAKSYNNPTDTQCTVLLQNDGSYNQCSSCYGIELSGNVNNIIGNTYMGIVDSNSAYVGNNGNVYVGNCDLNKWIDISSNCFNYQLCKNKDLAKKAFNMQNKYGDSAERYTNIKKEYDYAVLHAINIISGIFVVGGITFYYMYE
jgi:hypothetical protein